VGSARGVREVGLRWVRRWDVQDPQLCAGARIFRVPAEIGRSGLSSVEGFWEKPDGAVEASDSVEGLVDARALWKTAAKVGATG